MLPRDWGFYTSNAWLISKKTKYPLRKMAICSTIEKSSKDILGTNNFVTKAETPTPMIGFNSQFTLSI